MFSRSSKTCITKICIMMILVLSGMIGVGHAVNTNAVSYSDDKKVSWLFDVTSDKAEVKKSNGKMQLTMPEGSEVIAFADRPFRIVKKNDYAGFKKPLDNW